MTKTRAYGLEASARHELMRHTCSRLIRGGEPETTPTITRRSHSLEQIRTFHARTSTMNSGLTFRRFTGKQGAGVNACSKFVAVLCSVADRRANSSHLGKGDLQVFPRKAYPRPRSFCTGCCSKSGPWQTSSPTQIRVDFSSSMRTLLAIHHRRHLDRSSIMTRLIRSFITGPKYHRNPLLCRSRCPPPPSSRTEECS